MIEPSINKPVSMSNVNIVKVTVQCSLRSKQSSLSVLMKEATQGVGDGGKASARLSDHFSVSGQGVRGRSPC